MRSHFASCRSGARVALVTALAVAAAVSAAAATGGAAAAAAGPGAGAATSSSAATARSAEVLAGPVHVSCGDAGNGWVRCGVRPSASDARPDVPLPTPMVPTSSVHGAAHDAPHSDAPEPPVLLAHARAASDEQQQSAPSAVIAIVNPATGLKLAELAITGASLLSHTTRVDVTTAFPTKPTHFGGGLRATPARTETARVRNTEFFTPSAWYASSPELDQPGFNMLVVVDEAREVHASSDPFLKGAEYPVSFSTAAADTNTNANTNTNTAGTLTSWVARGSSVDVYVALAASRRHALTNFWRLTGAPKLPPVYALGFLASRWGWRSRAYVSDVLDEFDLTGTPLDAFVMDFEWYANATGDYAVPPAGAPNFPDFAFGNRDTFPDVAGQQYEYAQRNVLMGGIRKPRLGDAANLATARAQPGKWLLRPAASRDLNFSSPTLRQWYADQHARAFAVRRLPHFYWNDEGETSYFTYHGWITAQQLEAGRPATARRFSINRGFTPGLQRLEAAAVWTGDVPSTWDALARHVGLLVEWGEAGVALPSMDVGGFNAPDAAAADADAALLVRWMQLGAFAGVMRVHSRLDRKPHFPLPSVWGNAAAKTMRAAVRLRYRLLPTVYAVAHVQARLGWGGHPALPIMERPAKELGVPSFLFANKSLLVLPVVDPNSTLPQLDLAGVARDGDEGAWFPFFLGESGDLAQGPPVALTAPLQAPMGVVPAYARPGSVILMDDDTFVVRAVENVGARKTVAAHVFPGAPCMSLPLFEDDGLTQSTDVRVTVFSWDDAAKRLSWVSTLGVGAAPVWYAAVRGVLHDPVTGALSVVEADVRAGAIQF